ncbi:MAG TPA: CpaF family protein, partial [Acetobacteraceae bacterium]|nr:CpaF family protein [Acetobacteraceae bacterium]
MNAAAGPLGFGRRGLVPQPGRASAAEPAEEAPPVVAPRVTAPMESLAELRAACLARLEPAAVAALPPDRLTAEIERLISEIATDRRIHLNAREQRQLAGELVNDMLGLGPLEQLLEDDSIADIMVNGPFKVFVERGGKVVLADVRFRDENHLASICQRIAVAVG